MTPEAWGFFSLLTASTFGLLSETVRTRKRVEKAAVAADDAAVNAQQAVEATKPISNGFAASVLNSLESLKDSHTDLHAEIREVKHDLHEHMRDHIKEAMRLKE